MIVDIESLDKVFEQNDNARHLCLEGQCCHCGSDVKIQIDKTNAGYGLLGGVLYEPNPQDFLVCCDHCYKKLGAKFLEYDYSI